MSHVLNHSLPRRRRRVTAAAAAAVTVAGTVTAVVVTAGVAGAVTNPTPAAGSRRSATQLSFGISGTAGLSVDVGTGNGLFTDQLISLPGVSSSLPIELWYNTSVYGSSVPSAVTGTTGSGWGITGFDQRLVSNSDGTVTYYGVGGLTGVFTPNSSGGGFTAPTQFRATLATVSGGGWTLLDHTSQEKLTFNSSGLLTTDADRNGNQATFAYDQYGNPQSITSTRGPAKGRLLTVHDSGGRITSLTQSSGSLSRTITIGYTSGGHVSSVTDPTSGVTSFASASGSDTSKLATITSPLSSAPTTTVSYVGTGTQVASVAQTNPSSDGGAGTSTTRFSYVSATETQVADPTTDQTQAVSAVPHTTYTLDSNGDQLVASAEDADGNTRSTTYSPLQDIASSTPASGGATNYTYGSNSGESLTKIATTAGASDSAAYTNTGASQYLPSSTTDDAGNALQYTYNGQGNQLTSGQTATGPQAKVTYNTDGTPATSSSPGAASGVDTAYGYDTASPATHDLVSITPPTGTSLGARAYTWDAFGRLATETNGRGDTVTYTYDKADRITLIHHSSSDTPDVSYTYNPAGQVTQRVDGNGTTTYTYDDLNHLTSVVNTAGGGTISYTYDLAGDLASETSGQGTTTYQYDNALELTSMTYPQGSTTETLLFANDANGRRTDAWLQSNADHTTWAAHEHLTYDSSGRVIGALGQNGPASSPTNLINETLCYAAGSVAPACSTSTSADRSKIAWVSDTVTGETSTYTYDTLGQLTKDVITGGSNPRTYSYGYDAAGNRTSSSVTGTSPSSQSLTFNNGNQISTTGYTYDGSGNLTTQPGTTAVFNADGEQTSTTTGGATTSYTYAGSSQNELLSESTSGGNTYDYTYGRADSNGLPEIESVKLGSNTAYVAHDPSGLPVMLQTNSSLTTLYLYDGTGNPVALSTSASTTSFNLRYDPYGASTRIDSAGSNGGVNDNPFLFHGGVQDRATGQIKFGARWYQPVTATWTQQDNLNAPLDPENANRYEYAGDDPINESDPTGQCGIFSCITDVIGSPVDIIGGTVGGLLFSGCEIGSGTLGTVACAALGAAAGDATVDLINTATEPAEPAG